MTDRLLEIDVPPRLDELWVLRHVLRAAVPALHDHDDDLYLGAVTEIVVNAIEAHERVDRTDAVVVAVDVDETGGRLVCVEDRGGGIPVDTSPPEHGHLGMGRRIAASVVPAMTTTPTTDGTTVVLPVPSE